MDSFVTTKDKKQGVTYRRSCFLLKTEGQMEHEYGFSSPPNITAAAEKSVDNDIRLRGELGTSKLGRSNEGNSTEDDITVGEPKAGKVKL